MGHEEERGDGESFEIWPFRALFEGSFAPAGTWAATASWAALTTPYGLGPYWLIWKTPAHKISQATPETSITGD